MAQTGRAVSGHYSVNVGIHRIDVDFDQPDPLNPIGVKGLGEVAVVGVSAAIGNAIFHAAGARFRRLPIHIEDVLDSIWNSSPSGPPVAHLLGSLVRFVIRAAVLTAGFSTAVCAYLCRLVPTAVLLGSGRLDNLESSRLSPSFSHGWSARKGMPPAAGSGRGSGFVRLVPFEKQP